MQVFFKIDKAYDSKAVWDILHEYDPAGILSRAESMGILGNDLEYVLSMDEYSRDDSCFRKIIDLRYEENNSMLERSVELYQNAWNEMGDLFSQQIERITGVSWKYEEYFVVLSPFNPGISNRDGNVVVRSCFEDPRRQRRITAHEILMTHIWHIVDSSPEFPTKGEMPLWALNEMTTVAILSLEPSLNKIWGDNFEKFLQNYPILEKPKMQIRDLYLVKQSFDSYLIQASEVAEKIDF